MSSKFGHPMSYKEFIPATADGHPFDVLVTVQDNMVYLYASHTVTFTPEQAETFASTMRHAAFCAAKTTAK